MDLLRRHLRQASLVWPSCDDIHRSTDSRQLPWIFCRVSVLGDIHIEILLVASELIVTCVCGNMFIQDSPYELRSARVVAFLFGIAFGSFQLVPTDAFSVRIHSPIRRSAQSVAPTPSIPKSRIEWNLYSTSPITTTDGVERKRSIRRPLILVDDATGQVLSQGYEMEPFPEERDKPDEDELEILYPTQRQYFQFTESSPLVQVRSTSFGCSKMGHQVWPSSLALCLSLIHDFHQNPQHQHQEENGQGATWPTSVLELGAGCGLPSILCRDVLQIPRVVATDFWYADPDPAQRIQLRLVPEVWHGINLEYNVQRLDQGAIVRPLDWHDLDSVRQAATPKIDLVIASDVVYYHMDTEPLWNTMNVLLRECGARKVVLVLPVKPETRESLPMFVELLESKAASGAYTLHQQHLHLYKSQESFDARQDSDRFIKFTLGIPT